MTRLSRTAVAVAALMTLAGCFGGLRMAQQYDMAEAYDASKAPAMVKTMAGFNPAMGLPTLAERFAKRPGLKLALLQTSVTIQGDHDARRMTRMSHWSGSAYSTTETEYQVVKGLKVPPAVGFAVAGLFRQNLEESLKAQRLPLIPFERIAATRAYQQGYGRLPEFETVKPETTNAIFMNFFDGWSTFAAPGMRAQAPKDVTKINGAPLFVPAETLKAIRQELGEDVIFISAAGRITNNELLTGTQERSVHQISSDTWYHYDRRGHFAPTAFVTLFDPDFVGVGPGGVGVMAGTLDAGFKSAPRPDFIKKRGNDWEVRWGSFLRDSKAAYGLIATAMGTTIKEYAFPPKP